MWHGNINIHTFPVILLYYFLHTCVLFKHAVNSYDYIMLLINELVEWK